MLSKITAMSLLLCCFAKSEGLRNLWQEGVGITDEHYECFHKAYLSPDGFCLWKHDGEYLMSNEFLSEFIAEGCDPDSKSLILKRYWVGEGLITGGFDRVFGSNWPEENRDAAIPFVKTMIAFYRTYILQIPDGSVKQELTNTIGDLERLESYFKYLTDPYDVEQTFEKES